MKNGERGEDKKIEMFCSKIKKRVDSWSRTVFVRGHWGNLGSWAIRTLGQLSAFVIHYMGDSGTWVVRPLDIWAIWLLGKSALGQCGTWTIRLLVDKKASAFGSGQLGENDTKVITK